MNCGGDGTYVSTYGDDASSVVRKTPDICGDDASSVVRKTPDIYGDDASSVVRIYGIFLTTLEASSP